MEVAVMMPFPALALASSLFAVVADRVPVLKVEPSCRAAGSVAMSTGRTMESCMNDENAARDELGTAWAKFSADDKSHCLSMVSTGGGPSYVELLSCLEMSRDAKLIAQGRSVNEAPPTRRK